MNLQYITDHYTISKLAPVIQFLYDFFPLQDPKTSKQTTEQLVHNYREKFHKKQKKDIKKERNFIPITQKSMTNSRACKIKRATFYNTTLPNNSLTQRVQNCPHLEIFPERFFALQLRSIFNTDIKTIFSIRYSLRCFDSIIG